MSRWWIFNVLCRRRNKDGKLIRKPDPPPPTPREIFFAHLRRFAYPDWRIEKLWRERQKGGS